MESKWLPLFIDLFARPALGGAEAPRGLKSALRDWAVLGAHSGDEVKSGEGEDDVGGPSGDLGGELVEVADLLE